MKNRDFIPPTKKYPALREFEKLEIYRVTVCEGLGVEDDPVRLVDYYYTSECVLLTRVDSYVATLPNPS
jgi:hypothetical protein